MYIYICILFVIYKYNIYIHSIIIILLLYTYICCNVFLLFLLYDILLIYT